MMIAKMAPTGNQFRGRRLGLRGYLDPKEPTFLGLLIMVSFYNKSSKKVGFLGLALSIKIAPKPYITGSLGPNALRYESFEGKGLR